MRQTCRDGDYLLRGRYYLYNNLWGAGSGSGSQCVWEAPADGSQVAWGTRWDWAGPNDSIKSYAAVVLGWHWGFRVADTGLPMRVSAIRSARTSWKYQLTEVTAGGMNVTYDLWLSDDAELGNEAPSGEIMIWLHHASGITPIGSRKADVVIAGTAWCLWEGPHPVSGWPVRSFVRSANTSSESLDLADFFGCLASLGLACPEFLLGVEAGVEVVTGAGALDTTAYSLEIEPVV